MAARLSSRPHFGQGELQLEFAKSVFINCPYDAEFAARFDAMVFAIACCGFMPRSALESGDMARSRIERIAHAIFSSKYSIHDLSRCRGEGDEQTARFNMPLELGMAMACRLFPMRKYSGHDWFTLVPEAHQYVKFVSDLAGFDLKPYDATAQGIVFKIVPWLAGRPDALSTPTSAEVLRALPGFAKKKQRLVRKWGADVPWADIVLAARESVPSIWRFHPTRKE